MKMNQSNIFRGIFLAAILFIGVRAEYNSVEDAVYHGHTIQTDTAMKFEAFLQALSNELPVEVEAYATEAAERVAKETTISTLQQFSENLKKIDVKLDR